jgi:uncharacterized membrane protein YheB (UPF0754 family)
VQLRTERDSLASELRAAKSKALVSQTNTELDHALKNEVQTLKALVEDKSRECLRLQEEVRELTTELDKMIAAQQHVQSTPPSRVGELANTSRSSQLVAGAMKHETADASRDKSLSTNDSSVGFNLMFDPRKRYACFDPFSYYFVHRR